MTKEKIDDHWHYTLCCRVLCDKSVRGLMKRKGKKHARQSRQAGSARS